MLFHPVPRLWSGRSRFLIPLAILAVLLAGGCAHPGEQAAAPVASTAAATAGDAVDGEAVYLRLCIGCHQFNGLGLPGAFPPLAGVVMVTAADPGRIIRIVLHGLQGPIQVKGMNYNSVMPAPAPALTDKEVADVLTYVRNDWGNEAAPVTVEAVAAIRTQDERKTPWTWAELEKL